MQTELHSAQPTQTRDLILLHQHVSVPQGFGD